MKHTSYKTLCAICASLVTAALTLAASGPALATQISGTLA